jgi:hypothetical protein
MAEPKDTTLPTKKEIAAAVKRTVVQLVIDPKTKKPELDDNKKVKTETVKKEVAEDEVLSYRVDGLNVVVVTTDGQKLTGTLPAPKA